MQVCGWFDAAGSQHVVKRAGDAASAQWAQSVLVFWRFVDPGVDASLMKSVRARQCHFGASRLKNSRATQFSRVCDTLGHERVVYRSRAHIHQADCTGYTRKRVRGAWRVSELQALVAQAKKFGTSTTRLRLSRGRVDIIFFV